MHAEQGMVPNVGHPSSQEAEDLENELVRETI